MLQHVCSGTRVAVSTPGHPSSIFWAGFPASSNRAAQLWGSAHTEGKIYLPSPPFRWSTDLLCCLHFFFSFLPGSLHVLPMRSGGGGGGVEAPDGPCWHRRANRAWLFSSALSVQRSFVPSVLKAQGRLHSTAPSIHCLACWLFSSTLSIIVLCKVAELA